MLGGQDGGPVPCSRLPITRLLWRVPGSSDILAVWTAVAVASREVETCMLS